MNRFLLVFISYFIGFSAAWAEGVKLYTASDLSSFREVCRDGQGEMSVELRTGNWRFVKFTKYNNFCRITPYLTGSDFIYCKSIQANVDTVICNDFAGQQIQLGYFNQDNAGRDMQLKDKAFRAVVTSCTAELNKYCSKTLGGIVEESLCILDKTLNKGKAFVSESCKQSLQ